MLEQNYATDSKKLFQLKERVINFNLLHENWDGYGAKKIPMPTIDAAVKFLEFLNKYFVDNEPKSGAPSPSGEIVIYWRSPKGYVEVNFDSFGSLTLGWKQRGGEVQLIEESAGYIFAPDWIENSAVWNKLSMLLIHGF